MSIDGVVEIVRVNCSCRDRCVEGEGRGGDCRLLLDLAYLLSGELSCCER